MAVLKIQDFAGIAPRYSARLLPQNGAVQASNAKLYSGELRGLHETSLLYDFSTAFPSTPVARAYRLPASVAAPLPISGSDTWIGFTSPGVDFVRTPVLQDSFERYYWTGDTSYNGGAPQYNTRARIQASSPAYLLGVPGPVNTPTVTPPGGSNLTRSYVYTFVSAYGEEGPPGLPGVATGTSGAWVITNFDTTVPGNRNITTVRIYRTVASAGLTVYYHVADVALGTTTYTDSANDSVVALNYTMSSLTWTGPPATLQGIIAHPGGFLCGFSGRDLYLSEPYQPHAWPLQYVKTMQTEIVGIAIFNNAIIVMTTSHPYIGTGMSPAALTMQKLDSIDPCVSRRSIAVTLDGVYYASPQGIVKNDSTQSTLVTSELFTRQEWQQQFSPTTVNAAPYGLQYIAFDTTALGFIFSPAEKLAPLSTLDRFSNVATIMTDAYSGDCYLVQNNQARLWDPVNTIPYSYTWISKEFDLPEPVNFGAMRVKFVANPQSVALAQLADYTTFNNGRIAKPLNPYNWCSLNGHRTVTVTGYTQPQFKQPIGGSPLFNISALTTTPAAVTLSIYARDLSSNWDLQYQTTISDERIHKLPAGYKSDAWQIELVGNSNVYSVTLAGNGLELKKA